jgi:alpha/beta superfamily hydrolase
MERLNHHFPYFGGKHMQRQISTRQQFNLGQWIQLLLVMATAFVFLLFTVPTDTDSFDDDAPCASSAAWVSLHADSVGNRKAPTPKQQREIAYQPTQPFSFQFSLQHHTPPTDAQRHPQYDLSTDKIRDPPHFI